MSYQVLARKWRPKKFQEVIGQDHITRSLQNALLSKNIGHAYIFTGTRGIGKTSIARIFAKALRCTNLHSDGNPCNECVACKEFQAGASLNVIEIDGASNNSVEDIRNLISNVHYLPTTGDRKVYIIDEVHMLSISAFNALLKTLEEPPAHVIFIFATTEPRKLPSTILSRFQRFDFRNVSIFQLKAHIKDIAKKESITFDSERTLEVICEQGQGSVRDTLSLLDQVLSYAIERKVDAEVVSLSLGIANEASIKSLLKSMLVGDVDACTSTYVQLLSENVDIKNIVSGILNNLFDLVQSNVGLSKKDTQVNGFGLELGREELIWVFETLSKDFAWAMNATIPEKVINVIIQKIALRRQFFNQEQSVVLSKTSEEKLDSDPGRKNSFESEDKKKEQIEEPEFVVEVIPTSAEQKTWDGFLNFLKSKSPVTCANLEQGNILSPVEFLNDKLVVKLGFNKSSKVFFDYINESLVYTKLSQLIVDYFEIEKDKLDLALEMVALEAHEKEFKSRVQLLQDQEKDVERHKTEEMKNNPFLKEAERLFNTKIDKIILNKNI